MPSSTSDDVREWVIAAILLGSYTISALVVITLCELLGSHRNIPPIAPYQAKVMMLEDRWTVDLYNSFGDDLPEGTYGIPSGNTDYISFGRHQFMNCWVRAGERIMHCELE